MRIRKLSSTGLPPSPEPPHPAGARDAAAGASHDSTRISTVARQIAASRAYVEDAPDVRELRVRAIKKSIENGTYTADPEEIARKILDHGLGRP